MRFTIFGGGGFIGGALARYLTCVGHDVIVPVRDTVAVGGDLGHVIYAIGLTSDFRTRPMETVDAHVGAMADRFKCNEFQSWLYLSSTRVYAGSDVATASETIPLMVRPDADGLYNISKLLGEAICLSSSRTTVRVARIANVFGPDAHVSSFLGTVLHDARTGRDIVIGEAPSSSKDYVAIDDVCWLIERVALGGRERLYNVASGSTVTHAQIADVLREAGASVTFAADGAMRTFPRIDIARASAEFGYCPASLLDRLPALTQPIPISAIDRA